MSRTCGSGQIEQQDRKSGMNGDETMKLGEIHADIERYLMEDCYCPGEIYDTSGFFYQIFTIDDTCTEIESSDDMTAVVALTSNGNTLKNPQAIMFWHDDGDGRIVNAQRVDATDNNIGILRSIVRGMKPDGRQIDEFKQGEMASQMKKILSICDGIIVS